MMDLWYLSTEDYSATQKENKNLYLQTKSHQEMSDSNDDVDKLAQRRIERMKRKFKHSPTEVRRSLRFLQTEKPPPTRQCKNLLRGKRSELRQKIRGVVPYGILKQARSLSTLSIPGIDSIEIPIQIHNDKSFQEEATYLEAAMNLFYKSLQELPEDLSYGILGRLAESTQMFPSEPTIPTCNMIMGESEAGDIVPQTFGPAECKFLEECFDMKQLDDDFI